MSPAGISMAAVLLAASLVAGAARAASAPDVDAEIRAVNAAEVRDFLTADAPALASLWADTFVVTNPLNRFVAKADVLGMVGSGMLRFSAYERSIEYVRAYGDIAVVAGAETVGWAGRMPLAGKSSHLRFTAVWRRTGDGWQEIARHANIVPDR
jgi:ketosteroid isomerase-like protein